VSLENVFSANGKTTVCLQSAPGPAFPRREKIARATNQRWLGGTSHIVRIFTPNGRHIGTLHEIVLADGSGPHSPEDYTRRDCTKITSD